MASTQQALSYGVAKFTGVAKWMLEQEYSWLIWSSGPSGKRVQNILVLHNPGFATGRTPQILPARVIATEEGKVVMDAPSSIEARAGDDIIVLLAMAIASGNKDSASLSYGKSGPLADIVAGKVSWSQSVGDRITQDVKEQEKTAEPPKIVTPTIAPEPLKSSSSMTFPLIGGGLLLLFLLMRRR